MRPEVVCVGQPFLDLHVYGLGRLPGPGEERTGSGAELVAGGAATTAIACSRLGLETLLLAPRPEDRAGELLRSLVAEAEVRWDGPPSPHCALTVALPVDGERTMISCEPGPTCDPAEAAALGPASIVADLDRLVCSLPCRVYATVGDEQAARMGDGVWREHVRHAHALLVNAREAELLTGSDDPEAAATALAEVCGTAVVTLGDRGAIASDGGPPEAASAPAVAVADPTGAGDLFVAAYVWAEARGLALGERLRLACAYASLSAAAGPAAEAALDEAALKRQTEAPERAAAGQANKEDG